MTLPAEPVRVSILGKEYQIACPVEERADLFASAALLDQRMRAVRDAGRIVGGERIAVMVALNLANEMLQFRRSLEGVEQGLPDRLDGLADTIEKKLLEMTRDAANAR